MRRFFSNADMETMSTIDGNYFIGDPEDNENIGGNSYLLIQGHWVDK